MKDVTEEIQENEQALEMIESSVPLRYWEVKGLDGNGVEQQRQYVQEELGFYPVQDFVTLATKYVEKFITGELGVSLGDIFQGDLRSRINLPTEMSTESAEQMMKENEQIIIGVIKAIQALPDLEISIMLLSLGVPRNERDWAAQVLRNPVSRGGLTRKQGFDLLKTFISQNTRAILDFFSQEGRDLVEHAQREIFGEESDESTEPETTETKEDLSTEPELAVAGATHGGTPSSTSSPDIPPFD